MAQYGIPSPYAGAEALVLAAVLFVIAAVLVYLGTRLHHPVKVQKTGTTDENIKVHFVFSGGHVLCVRSLGFVRFRVSFRPNILRPQYGIQDSCFYYGYYAFPSGETNDADDPE